MCEDVASILRKYGINNLQGDQYAAVAIKDKFQELGITYRETIFGRRTRPQLFNNLRHLIQQQRIELLDDPKLLAQLRSLEEHKGRDGNLDVRADRGLKDDLAIVVALTALELSEVACDFPLPPISLGRASRPWEDRFDDIRRGWGVVSVGQMQCPKFPKCWDIGCCECYGND